MYSLPVSLNNQRISYWLRRTKYHISSNEAYVSKSQDL